MFWGTGWRVGLEPVGFQEVSVLTQAGTPLSSSLPLKSGLVLPSEVFPTGLDFDPGALGWGLLPPI